MLSDGEPVPPGETGATLDLEQVLCLLASLDFFLAFLWERMPRAGSRAYHARSPVVGCAYVLRGRFARRAAELARAQGVRLSVPPMGDFDVGRG